MATKLFRGGADTHTVMAAGGWTSAEAMSKYVLVDIDTARRGYSEALRRLAETKHSAPSKMILSPAAAVEGR